MKRIYFLAALAIIALAVSAQSVGGGRSSGGNSFFSTEKPEKGVTIGIRGGLNFSGISGERNSEIRSSGQEFKTKLGYNAGLSIDFPIIKSMYIQSGVYYTAKYFKSEHSLIKNTYEYSPSYIEIPVLASYRFDFGNSMQLQFNLGPYVAYGIFGNRKIEPGDLKTKLFTDEKLLKPFDMGINIGLGLTINKFFIGVSYEKGLVDIQNKSSFGMTNVGSGKVYDSIKTYNFMTNVGYNF